MSKPKQMLFARVDDSLREQVRAEAALRFEGNESVLVRDAIRLYLRLRRHLGTAFEPTVESLAPTTTAPVEEAA